jgi:hypothetical protein
VSEVSSVLEVGGVSEVSRRAAASNSNVAGGSTGSAGVSPAKGFTTESTRVVIAVVITSGSFVVSTCGVAVCCGTVDTSSTAGMVTAGSGSGVVAACVVSAAESGVSLVVLEATVSECADEVGVSVTSVFADGSGAERMAVAAV